MKKWLMASACAAAALTAQPTIAANIIVNGGFESGSISPWFQSASFSGGVDWTVTSDAHSGSFAAFTEGNKVISQNFVAVPVSEIVSASLWLRHPNGSSISAVEFHYSDSGRSGFTATTSGGDWQRFDAMPFLTAGKTLSGISVSGFAGGFSDPFVTMLDDVEFHTADTAGAVPEPSTWTMLIVGFGAVGYSLRRRRPLLAQAV